MEIVQFKNHSNHLINAFNQMRSQERLIDLSLLCGGHVIRAHKIILSACSSFFRKELLQDNDTCNHSILTIGTNIRYEDLAAIVDCIYQGEVHIFPEARHSFEKTAELFGIQFQVRKLDDHMTASPEDKEKITSGSSKRGKRPIDNSGSDQSDVSETERKRFKIDSNSHEGATMKLNKQDSGFSDEGICHEIFSGLNEPLITVTAVSEENSENPNFNKSGEDATLYQCKVCQKGFKNARTLNLHKVIHDENRSKCPVCKKGYSRVSNLKKHLANVHKAYKDENSNDVSEK